MARGFGARARLRRTPGLLAAAAPWALLACGAVASAADAAAAAEVPPEPTAAAALEPAAAAAGRRLSYDFNPEPAAAAAAETPPEPAAAAAAKVPPVPAAAAAAEVPPLPAAAAAAEVPPEPAAAAAAEVPPEPAAAAAAKVPPVPAAAADPETPPEPAAATAAETPPEPAATAAPETPPEPTAAAAAEVPPEPTAATAAEVPPEPAAAATAEVPPEPAAAAAAEVPPADIPEPPPVDVMGSAVADAAEAAMLEEEAEAAAADEAAHPKRLVKLEAAEPISLPPGTPLAVPSVFASHMVVPAGVDFTIWGLAEVGTGPVNVIMNGHSVSAKLKGDGRWTVTLPAMSASKAPTSIGISSTKSTIELEDVLVGDVYVCIGADNMAMPLSMSSDSSQALELAEAMGDRLRIMSVKQTACCADPQDNFTARTSWQGTRSEGHTESFSALCYNFGVEQLDARPDLPVGLIQVTAEGSQSWQWAPPHSAEKCQKPGDVAEDSVGIYWNSMLRPLAALKGPRAFLYELGGDGCVSIDTLAQMQEIWRAGRQGDLENEVPAVIGAQYSCTSPAELTRADYDYQQAFMQLPRSGVAVTSDLCSVNARGCGSHSPFKREEAKRFAIRAEALLDKKGGVPANAPKPVHVFVDRYEPSWGSFHYGVVGDFTCHTCVWGMRVVFDQDVKLQPEFDDFHNNYNGHVNGFQLYPNTKPGLDFFPVTMQLNWVGGNTVQLNVTVKVGALGVDSPWPGRLQYGEGPFPVMPLVSSATGEPVPQLSIEVPLGDGKDDLKQLDV